MRGSTLIEPLDLDVVDQAFSAQIEQTGFERVLPIHVDIAVCAQDKNPVSSRTARQQLKELETGVVGPVKIVQKNGNGAGKRNHFQQVRDGAEEALLILLVQ